MNERPTLELSAEQVEADPDGGAFLITMPGDLTRNAAQCLACGNTIESKRRNDYRTCGCPNGTMVDGGLAYRRWGAVDPSQILDLSEYGPPSVLVALNQPCPKCSGRGWTSNGDRTGYRQDPCIVCGGSGRLVFDLKTPCPKCTGPNFGSHDVAYGAPMTVTDPCRNGIVSHRVWLDPEWGILPITYEGEGDEMTSEGCGSPHALIFTGCIAGMPTRRLIICDGANDPDTVVTDDVGEAPPAARPGDYVARTVRVAE